MSALASLDNAALIMLAQQTLADLEEFDAWPEPQPLCVKVAPEPYPLDALPGIIRAAVEEVAGFVKAPVPLVASSALAALSLAAQAHIDVKRADKLHGPVGLFLADDCRFWRAQIDLR